MANDRMMSVKVVQKDTERAKLVLMSCPTWSDILGEEISIDLFTAKKKGSFVHFSGTVKTGKRAGAVLTISTAILDLTREQYGQIDGLIGGETAATA